MAEQDEIGDLINHIVKDARIPAKSRSTDIKPHIQSLASLCYTHGATPTHLTTILTLLTTSSDHHLTQASQNSLITALYPLQKVSSSQILPIIGCLGFGDNKPSLAIQSKLLEWIILVHHVLDDGGKKVLVRAYGVLFGLVGVDALRPQVFGLLALVTGRRHVTRWRVQALLALAAQKGGDAYVQGLLRIYKNYYPEIPVVRTTKSPFKLPDREWRARLEVIQRQHRQLQADAQGSSNGFKVNHSGGQNGSAALIPTVQTSNTHLTSITLEEIDGADRLVQNLEKIEPPDYMIAVLVDPLLQRLLFLRPEMGSARAESWIESLADDIESGRLPENDLLQLLKYSRDYARSARIMLPFAPQLISAYEQARGWVEDEEDWRLDILTYKSLVGWDTFYASPTRVCLEERLDGTAESQTRLLNSYTKLLLNWTTLLLSTEPTPSTHQTVADLTEYVNNLCITISQNTPSETALHSILDFYDQLFHTLSHDQLPTQIVFALPSAPVVYILFFHTSPAISSRLCSLLAGLKAALAKRMAQGPGATGLDKSQIDGFNSFLMDACNCLWRNKAFSKTDKLAQGCLVSDPVVEALREYVAGLGGQLSLDSLLSVSYAPALSLQSIGFMRERENAEDEEYALRARQAGPVTAKSLKALALRGGIEMGWQDYKAGVLGYLGERGLDGVPRLMYGSFKGLNGGVL